MTITYTYNRILHPGERAESEILETARINKNGPCLRNSPSAQSDSGMVYVTCGARDAERDWYRTNRQQIQRGSIFGGEKNMTLGTQIARVTD